MSEDPSIHVRTLSEARNA